MRNTCLSWRQSCRTGVCKVLALGRVRTPVLQKVLLHVSSARVLEYFLSTRVVDRVATLKSESPARVPPKLRTQDPTYPWSTHEFKGAECRSTPLSAECSRKKKKKERIFGNPLAVDFGQAGGEAAQKAASVLARARVSTYL